MSIVTLPKDKGFLVCIPGMRISFFQDADKAYIHDNLSKSLSQFCGISISGEDLAKWESYRDLVVQEMST